jgi:hypothetical protein
MENDPLTKARCLACKYSLRGLPEGTNRCPECGRPFDPRDRRTFDDGSSGVKWARWAGPPGWLHGALSVIAVGLILYAASDPFGVHCWVCGALPVLFYYLFRGGLALHFWWQRVPAVRRRSRAWWLATPVCLLIVVSALATAWPFRLRFALSRTELEAEAQRLLTAPSTAPVFASGAGWARYQLRRKIGAYEVHFADVDTERGHVYFITGGFIRGWGLLYVGDSSEPPGHGWVGVSGLPTGWGLFAYP